MPSALKIALVKALLKKQRLDPEVLNNYRPVSNLPFLSKVIERIVAARLFEHMQVNNLHECFQCAYKEQHSVESALLRVYCDIMEQLDNKKCILLVLLYLSAAFDSIDHNVLLDRLPSSDVLYREALKWFSSYLFCRLHAVLINDDKSGERHTMYGVLRDRSLDPFFSLFIIIIIIIIIYLES